MHLKLNNDIILIIMINANMMHDFLQLIIFLYVILFILYNLINVVLIMLLLHNLVIIIYFLRKII